MEEITNLVLGFIFLFIGIWLLVFSIHLLRDALAYKRCQKWIDETGQTHGVYIKHGMVLDKKTGLIRGTSTPSDAGIRAFRNK